MNIKQVKISDLKKYANNPRKNAGAVDAVANSIREFGFKNPVIIDKDNVIIAGHTRIDAAKKLGLKEVPCIVADDLTPEQVNAYRLADNKTAELAEWDFSALDDELEKILDIDMSEFGFEKISPDEFGDDFSLPNRDDLEFFSMAFKFNKSQKPLIVKALNSVSTEGFEELYDNTNKNGNAFYAVIKEWAELKKLS